jgi:hypothetical protein
MARKLDEQQQRLLTDFVNRLAAQAGYTTTAEWARESGYPASNLSNLRNGRGAVDGYNLVRLIRAAAARAAVEPPQLATDAAESPSVSGGEVADRLQGVEKGLTELATLMRQRLEQSTSGSGSSPTKKSRAERTKE